jgi:hypothetical protein
MYLMKCLVKYEANFIGKIAPSLNKSMHALVSAFDLTKFLVGVYFALFVCSNITIIKKITWIS